MDVSGFFESTQEVFGVTRVFGEPYEKDGVTVIPAAAVRGGGGGGGGGQADQGEGMGGGFGVSERPVGAIIIKNGTVSWEPAVDVTRIAIMANLVALALVWAVVRVARLRSRVRLRQAA